MKRVYASPYIADCDQLRVALSLAGIESMMKNEFGNPVGLAALGGAADFASPEVWVDEADYAAAAEIAKQKSPARTGAPESGASAWRCTRCGETIEGTMGACWKCETERPLESSVGN